MPKVIIISAPSGSGKTTIVRNIMQKYPELNLEFSVSATTRPKRPKETNGKDYYFITKDDFLKKIDNNEFVEWQEVYKGSYYGTLKSEIERLFAEGKNIIFDVDVKGALNLKKFFNGDALAIFIKAPSVEVLEQRLKKRGTDSDESIKKRIAKAKEELEYEKFFDLVVINDDLQTAINQTYNAIKNFLQARPQHTSANSGEN